MRPPIVLPRYPPHLGVSLKTCQLWKTNDTAICIHCGQCANVCPVDCITEVPEWEQVQAAIDDPERIVIFSTSPSVRVALGEEFEMEPGSFVQDKMVSLLRSLGADYVLDTNFSADLTIMEEASELIRRIQSNNIPIPQLTSCCPAWVKFVETFYPEFKENLSTSKSPIGMQGPTIKTYFAQKNGLDPRKIINVAVTPCTAKKFEIRRDEMRDAAGELGIEGMRGMDGIKEASLTVDGIKLDIAVVHGTANARRLLDMIKGGEKFYQFIEVMTCPGGCIGGGGQPKDVVADGEEIRKKRVSGLYNRDRAMKLRLSHENPEIKQVYEEFYEVPGGEKAKRMLHTSYMDRSGDLG